MTARPLLANTSPLYCRIIDTALPRVVMMS